MKFSPRLWAISVALIAGLPATPVFAANICWIYPTGNPADTFTYQYNIGSVYVPKDAAIGSVIGMFDQPFSKTSQEGRYIFCDNDGTSTLTFITRAVAPVFPNPLPPVQGEDVTGKVFETGIPGIGAMIKLRHPFDGLASASFVPMGKPTVPFQARLSAAVSAMRIRPLLGNVTLIKTGPIAPGPQAVDRLLFYAQFNLIPRAFDFHLSGTVVQAQCNVSTVSDDPVNLGDWRASDFSRAGEGTTPVAFNIRLGNCAADPGNVNVAWANIRLDGVNGSLPIPGIDGAFTLTGDSSAAGVGIQILRGDGLTPVPLARNVPLVALTPGDTVMDLSARYIQTGDSRDVVPGQAKGALSFTISYL